MQTIKNQKGITIIALVLSIIVMLILVTISIEVGTEAIKKSAKEDIKSNMLLIQGKGKIIKDKNMYDSNSALVGKPIEDATTYAISTGLQAEIDEIKNSNPETTKFYILEQTDLDNNGLGSIKINETEFYIIDYGTSEVYYSLGIDGKYSLTDMQEEE